MSVIVDVAAEVVATLCETVIANIVDPVVQFLAFIKKLVTKVLNALSEFTASIEDLDCSALFDLIRLRRRRLERIQKFNNIYHQSEDHEGEASIDSSLHVVSIPLGSTESSKIPSNEERKPLLGKNERYKLQGRKEHNDKEHIDDEKRRKLGEKFVIFEGATLFKGLETPFGDIPKLSIDPIDLDADDIPGYKQIRQLVEDIPGEILSIGETVIGELGSVGETVIGEIGSVGETVIGEIGSVGETIAGEIDDLLSEIPVALEEHFLQPLQGICNDGTDYLKDLLLNTLEVDKIPFKKIEELIIAKIDEVTVVVESIESSICSDAGNTLRSEVESVKQAVDEDLCDAEDAITNFASRKNICNRGLPFIQLAEKYLEKLQTMAPECAGGVETAAVYLPGAPEACASFASVWKIVFSVTNMAFDTVINGLEQYQGIKSSFIYKDACSCFPDDATYFYGSGCDGKDQNCDRAADDCHEDTTKPTIAFYSASLPNTAFRTDDEAIDFFKENVQVSDDCAETLEVNVEKDTENSSDGLSAFNVTVSDPRCKDESENATNSRLYKVKVDTDDPEVVCGFSEFGGINIVEDDGKKLFHYGDVERSDRGNMWYDSFMYYTIEDQTLDTISVEVSVESNEFQSNQETAYMVKRKKSSFQEQVKVYYNGTSCGRTIEDMGYSNPRCEYDDSNEIGFRFYEITVVATDSAGRKGSDTCHIIIVPECEGSEDNCQSQGGIFAGNFISHEALKYAIDQSDERYFLTSVESVWKTDLKTPPMEFVKARSNTPSVQPSSMPSSEPSGAPSSQPSVLPSNEPSSEPSRLPSFQPSGMPSFQPSSNPSGLPSFQPSTQPSGLPSSSPSKSPKKDKRRRIR